MILKDIDFIVVVVAFIVIVVVAAGVVAVVFDVSVVLKQGSTQTF